MSTEKLSELSKPVAWTTQEELIDSGAGAAFVWKSARGLNDEFSLYSQEYVSALLAELEKAQKHEKEWKLLCEAAAVDLDDWRAVDDKSRGLICKLADVIIERNGRIAELEAKLATPIKIVNYDEFFICHVSGASDDYCKGWVDGRNAAARDVGKAGFTVEDKQ